MCVATFVYTGAPESVTLPAGTRGVIATVSGAEGGTSLEEQVDPFGGAPSVGGKGGRETATIPVPGGATLTIVVGQMGTGGPLNPGGFGGYGGGGHASSRYGGNGGGGSFVFDAIGPLVAAGGGGGGGYDYNPVVMGHGDQQNPGGNGSGASAAGDGASVPFCCDGTAPYKAGGGGGATPTAGGIGGHPTLPAGYVFGQADGDYGSGPAIDAYNFGNGGSTHNGCCYYTGWAGGGGGGYYGGGGGGNIEFHLEGGGGGGGAGYVMPSAWAASSQTGVQPGDGEVTLRYYVGTCNAACATCTGPLATDCSSCGAGLVVSNGSCVPGTTTTTTTTTLAPPTTTTTSTTTTLVAPLCGPLPRTDCRTAAGAASLKIRNETETRMNQFRWKWARGDATTMGEFLDPVHGAATYRTCVYDASGLAQPLMQVDVVPGGTCGIDPCWRTSGTDRYVYKNMDGSAQGLTLVKLAAGIAGKAGVSVEGKGASLPVPALPLTLPVTAQLVVSDGVTTTCWQTTFTAVTRNDSTRTCANAP